MITFRHVLTSKKSLATAVLALALFLGGATQPALSQENPRQLDYALAYNSSASDEALEAEITEFISKKALENNLSANLLLSQLNQGLRIFGVSSRDVPSSVLDKNIEATRQPFETLLIRACKKAVIMVRGGVPQEQVDQFLTDSIKYGSALWGDSVVENLMGDGAIDQICLLAAGAGNAEAAKTEFAADMLQEVKKAASDYKAEMSKILAEHIDQGLQPYGISVSDLSDALWNQYLIETSPLFALGYTRIVKEATDKKKQGANNYTIKQFIYASFKELMKQWGSACAIELIIAGVDEEIKNKNK